MTLHYQCVSTVSYCVCVCLLAVSHLYEAPLLRLQRVEVLPQAALPPAQGLKVHFQLSGVGRQLGHLLSQTDEKSPVLALH